MKLADNKNNNDDQKDKEKKLKVQSFTYNADRVVGNGSFGVVFLATVNENNE